MKVSKHNYEGKKVFVGMDVHKKKYAISAVCDGVTVKRWSCEANPEAVADQLNRYFSGAEIFSAYEAGFSGFSLHRILVASGIKNIVVNAASIEIAKNDRVKTDKKDALKIAEKLSKNDLKCIYIPTLKEEAARALSRGREQAVVRRTQIANQIKMKLHYHGLKVDGLDTKLSDVMLKRIERLDLDPAVKFAFDELITAWRLATTSIKRFDIELQEQASKDSNEKTYRSAPGVGPVTARVLSNELGDMTRFDNERQLFSSTGLTPAEHSSGETVRRGHISRQGSSRIRAMLIEVAWRAIVDDASLREFYQRVSKGRNGKKAIVAVARKLIGRLRSCFLNKTEWRDLACAISPT